MGEDTKLHPAPSLRTFPSLQLAHEARSGQEAMAGLSHKPQEEGSFLPVLPPHPQPIPGAHTLIGSPLISSLNTQPNTVSFCSRLFSESPNRYLHQLSPIIPHHTGHPSHLRPMTCGTSATAVFGLSSQLCTCHGLWVPGKVSLKQGSQAETRNPVAAGGN